MPCHYVNLGLENWQLLLLSVEILIIGTQPPCFEEAQAAPGEGRLNSSAFQSCE